MLLLLEVGIINKFYRSAENSESALFSFWWTCNCTSVVDPNIATVEWDSSLSSELDPISPSTPTRLCKQNKSGSVPRSVERQFILNAYVQIQMPCFSAEETCIDVSELPGVSGLTILDIRRDEGNRWKLCAIVSAASRRYRPEAGRNVDCTPFALHRFFHHNKAPTMKEIVAQFCASDDLPILKS